MKKLSLLYIVLIFLFVNSCTQKPSIAFKTLVSDTSKSHHYVNDLSEIKRKTVLLNLAPINKGVDSFELRVWYDGYAFGTRLIDLKYDNNRWNCLEINYMGDRDMLDSLFAHSIKTPADIALFVKFFTSDSILQLPSQADIPHFVNNIGDGQSCQIEISTKSLYKLLNYHCPEAYADKYNTHFLSILMFLNTSFKFYSPWCKQVISPI